jgi:hypothetical protein
VNATTNIDGATGAGGAIQALRDAGWICAERDGGALEIDLSIPGAVFGARIDASGDPTTIRVDVLGAPPTEEASRHATSALLRRAAARLRPLRSRCDPGATEPWGWEIRLAPDRDAEAIEDALGALQAACELYGAEARALAVDAALAARHLECLGGDAIERERPAITERGGPS